MKKNRKILCIFIAIFSLFTLSTVAMASEGIDTELVVSELIAIDDTKLEDFVIENGESISIPLENGYIIEIGAEELSSNRSSFYKNIHGWLNLKNTFGAVVVTLDAYSSFLCDGSTANPVDAYGEFNATVPAELESIDEYYGPALYNSYTRVSFAGKMAFDGTNLMSITRTCRISCNAKGEYTTSWVV